MNEFIQYGKDLFPLAAPLLTLTLSITPFLSAGERMRRDIKKKQEILKEMPDGLAKRNLSERIDALVARWTNYEEYRSESRYRWAFWLALILFPLQISSGIQWLSNPPSWFPVNWWTVSCTVLGLSVWVRFLFWNFSGKTMDGQVPDAALVKEMRKGRIQRRIDSRIRTRRRSTHFVSGACALVFAVLMLQGRAHRSEWRLFIDLGLYRVCGVIPSPNSVVWEVCQSIDQIEDVRVTGTRSTSLGKKSDAFPYQYQ